MLIVTDPSALARGTSVSVLPILTTSVVGVVKFTAGLSLAIWVVVETPVVRTTSSPMNNRAGVLLEARGGGRGGGGGGGGCATV